MKKLAMCALLALAGTCGARAVMAEGCPDTAATSVPAEVKDSSVSTTCGLGISIFGLQLSVFGPDCPAARFIYPAHGECLGMTLRNHFCTAGGLVQVIYERCECVDITALGTGVVLPACECEVQAGGAGLIVDWTTEACTSA